MKKVFLMILLWWMAMPYALGEGTKPEQCVVDSLREAIVDALASQMALSTTQFRYRLKEITGETPQAYITNIRMQKARQLLDNISSQTTILDIALRCGYEDQGAFGRAFKRFFGVTPTEYLARNDDK